MAKRMNRNIDIKSRRVQQSVSKLDGFLRAEYNSEKNYLEKKDISFVGKV